MIAARNLTMLCVPEGGMNYDWDLTYIIDGADSNIQVNPQFTRWFL